MDFLANDNCLVLGKATLFNSEKASSREAMEPAGNQSGKAKMAWGIFQNKCL